MMLTFRSKIVSIVALMASGVISVDADENYLRNLPKASADITDVDNHQHLEKRNLRASRRCSDLKIETDISLPSNPRDILAGGVGPEIDIYRCVPSTDSDPPLIIFAGGGSIFSESYAQFAERVAKKGFVVVLIDKPISPPGSGGGPPPGIGGDGGPPPGIGGGRGPPPGVGMGSSREPSSGLGLLERWRQETDGGPMGRQGGPPVLNFANPLDFLAVTDYIETRNFPVDMEQIVLAGHSFGGGTVLSAINEECELCVPGTIINVPRHPGVKLAVAYGFSMTIRQQSWDERTNPDGIPFGVINGDGDINYLNDLEGENLTEGTFDRLTAPKAIVTIKNLDHFSICDCPVDPRRGDIPSDRLKENQIDIVADSLGLWAMVNFGIPEEREGRGKSDLDFCKRMETQGDRTNFEVVDCKEEY